MTSRVAYKGPRRKLVLAFDVGTTYSGISYSVLDPGQIPDIRGVTRFPAHEQLTGASKIPSIIYYDRGGKVRAVGAEAMEEGICEQAEDEKWVKAEWFKLHLRPKAHREVSSDIAPLPLNKTVVEVFADFLAYLFECASLYIHDAHPNGVDLWASVKGDIDFVLSQPNGWEGAQQAQMRRAAVLAGLIPNTSAGHSRLSFVTEGEASLHFAIRNGLATEAMKKGDGVVIVDAGGGTIDISSYSRNMSASQEVFEEVAVPQCHFHGSIYVDLHAHHFLAGLLSGTSFADDIDHIVTCFAKSTKLRFRTADTPQYIKFGSTKDNDPAHCIRYGQLKILGTDIADFFKPSVDCIIKAVQDQIKSARKRISHVVLVGGFSGSDYLLSKILAKFASVGLSIYRPDNYVNKAVSDGAISFYIDHFVRARISKLTYGMPIAIPYHPCAPDHRERYSQTFSMASGHKYVDGAFSIILPENTQISEMSEFKSAYFQEGNSPKDFKTYFSVWCYRGHNKTPKWMDVDKDNYARLCWIDLDLSHLPLIPRRKVTGPGTYYKLEFEMVLTLGLTELKAQVAWKERGIERRSAAKIVYDPMS